MYCGNTAPPTPAVCNSSWNTINFPTNPPSAKKEHRVSCCMYLTRVPVSTRTGKPWVAKMKLNQTDESQP